MTLEDALSDQRGEHLLHKHSSVMAIRLSLGPQDGWVWEGTPPSIWGVYKKIRGRQIVEQLDII